MSSNKYTYSYNSILKANGFGNKAHNLALLAMNGFNVPNGIGIPNYVISGLLSDAANFEDIIEQIKNCDLSHLLNEIRTVLTSQWFIVRSSSSFEDDINHPSYGLYQSEVCNVQTLEDAIRTCLLSVFSPSVVEYKSRFELSKVELLPLLIQQYLEGNISGVILTQNFPMRKLDQMLLEISYGSCSSVTSGKVQPDCYLFDTISNNIIPHIVKQSIDQDKVAKVIKEALRVREFFKAELDIEFTFVGENLFILQARRLPSR